MKQLAPLFALLGLLLLAPAAPARETGPGKSADPALWVVKDKDTTIYLFGSVHVLKPGTTWFDDEVKAAFDRSDMLMLEMVEPPQEEMAKLVGGLAVDPDGPPLSEKLSPDARAKYQAAMAGMGLPWQAFERFQPWMAGVSLAVLPLEKFGYISSEGVEKVLTQAARAAGKPVGGLETAAEQLGLFAGLPEAQQIAFLNETVDALPKAQGEFAAMTAAWANGKPDALARQMNESLAATPELADVLLYGRNARWAAWIAQRMEEPGTVFIAVGAGHLAGPRSVLDQLGAMHIRARRIGKREFGLR